MTIIAYNPNENVTCMHSGSVSNQFFHCKLKLNQQLRPKLLCKIRNYFKIREQEHEIWFESMLTFTILTIY